MNILECKNLTIGYGSDIVQSCISFNIEKGSYILIKGDNGVGKSTLIKTILGVIPPISGEMIKELTSIGYLPQQKPIQNSFPTIVKEVVMMGLQRNNKFFYSKEDKTTIDNVLKRVGIYDLRNKRFSKLSGGQQQKVLLCRALNISQSFLILDEPVTGLDKESTNNLYQLIKELNDNGTTIMMISHDNDKIEGITHILNINKDGVTLSNTGE